MHTPWGNSDSSKKITKGINFYGTPSHGGYKVSNGLLKTMPEYFQNKDGWYEEDSEWCKMVLCFPQFFSDKELTQAKDTLKRWYPYLYEKHFKVVLKQGESMKKDEDMCKETNKDKWSSFSAFGSWHKNVPSDMVGVFFKKDNVEKSIIISKDFYDTRKETFSTLYLDSLDEYASFIR